MNRIDQINFGGIVTIRDGLIAKQKSGSQVYRLESGDPSFSVFPGVKRAISNALIENKTHYTAGAGIPELRQAIFNKVTTENKINVNGVDNVLVTNGAMHGLYILFRALCEHGDEILMPAPTWTETADNVNLAGGKAVFVPMDLDPNYRYTAASIEQFITPKTKGIVINTPHNPTGRVTSEEETREILNLAEKHNLWVISDEAYEHILFNGKKHFSPGSAGYDKVISVFSFSKSYAMSGLRLGYIVVNDADLLLRMKKLLRCTINGVNSATQYGGAVALTEDFSKHISEMNEEYEIRMNVLYSALKNTKYLSPVEPEGAFYCWAKINDDWVGYNDKKDAWAMTNYLIDTFGVGSSPGSVFGAYPGNDQWVRFAFSCSTDQILAAAQILEHNI